MVFGFSPSPVCPLLLPMERICQIHHWAAFGVAPVGEVAAILLMTAACSSCAPLPVVDDEAILPAMDARSACAPPFPFFSKEQPCRRLDVFFAVVVAVVAAAESALPPAASAEAVGTVHLDIGFSHCQVEMVTAGIVDCIAALAATDLAVVASKVKIAGFAAAVGTKGSVAELDFGFVVASGGGGGAAEAADDYSGWFVAVGTILVPAEFDVVAAYFFEVSPTAEAVSTAMAVENFSAMGEAERFVADLIAAAAAAVTVDCFLAVVAT